ncbi:MAG: hypothetical protein ACI92S_002024, partial [Planctomycetaceae bacterium]
TNTRSKKRSCNVPLKTIHPKKTPPEPTNAQTQQLTVTRGEWKNQHHALKQAYMDRGNDAVAARRSEHLATITIAGQLVHEALDLPWEFSDPVETLWDELMASTPEARPAQRALHYAANWATANENRFHRTTPNSQPSNGWAGNAVIIETVLDPSFVSQSEERSNLYVSTVPTFTSHVDVSRLPTTRPDSIFMSPTSLWWET